MSDIRSYFQKELPRAGPFGLAGGGPPSPSHSPGEAKGHAAKRGSRRAIAVQRLFDEEAEVSGDEDDGPEHEEDEDDEGNAEGVTIEEDEYGEPVYVFPGASSSSHDDPAEGTELGIPEMKSRQYPGDRDSFCHAINNILQDGVEDCRQSMLNTGNFSSKIDQQVHKNRLRAAEEVLHARGKQLVRSFSSSASSTPAENRSLMEGTKASNRSFLVEFAVDAATAVDRQHWIAIVNGYWLDSLRRAPVFIGNKTWTGALPLITNLPKVKVNKRVIARPRINSVYEMKVMGPGPIRFSNWPKPRQGPFAPLVNVPRQSVRGSVPGSTKLSNRPRYRQPSISSIFRRDYSSLSDYVAQEQGEEEEPPVRRRGKKRERSLEEDEEGGWSTHGSRLTRKKHRQTKPRQTRKKTVHRSRTKKMTARGKRPRAQRSHTKNRARTNKKRKGSQRKRRN